ncbi:MAG TPA: DcrB-related protein [Minicystis sp.]|nr:DcrB-related protein [Minicystis sp.]
MSRYMFHEGSFESPDDVGLVDSTVHVLELDGAHRLFVDRRPLRAGATPRLLAASRTGQLERSLTRYTLIGERDAAGLPGFEVAAHYRVDSDLVYERRTHVAFDGGAFGFTMRGPMAARGDVDGRMDALLTSVRFRDETWDDAAFDACVYVTNDVAFDLPATSFVDRTIHELDAALPDDESLGLLVEREPVPAGATIGELARAHGKEQGRRLPLYGVLDVAELHVGRLPAVAVAAQWSYRGGPRLARALHVHTGAAHLAISATAPAPHKETLDRLFDQILATLDVHA